MIHPRRPEILAVAVGFAVFATAAVLLVSCGGSSAASADGAVRVTGEQRLIFEGEAGGALEAASEAAGFAVRRLRSADYVPIAGYVPDGATRGLTGVEFRYQVPGSKDGINTVTLIQLSGRHAPVSSGRADEPDPTPIDLGIRGAEAVRVDLAGGAVGYTVWFDSFTFHFGFYPEVPPEGWMEQIVRETLSD